MPASNPSTHAGRQYSDSESSPSLIEPSSSVLKTEDVALALKGRAWAGRAHGAWSWQQGGARGRATNLATGQAPTIRLHCMVRRGLDKICKTKWSVFGPALGCSHVIWVCDCPGVSGSRVCPGSGRAPQHACGRAPCIPVPTCRRAPLHYITDKGHQELVQKVDKNTPSHAAREEGRVPLRRSRDEEAQRGTAWAAEQESGAEPARRSVRTANNEKESAWSPDAVGGACRLDPSQKP